MKACPGGHAPPPGLRPSRSWRMTLISWIPPSIPSDRPPAGPRARRLP